MLSAGTNVYINSLNTIYKKQCVYSAAANDSISKLGTFRHISELLDGGRFSPHERKCSSNRLGELIIMIYK